MRTVIKGTAAVNTIVNAATGKATNVNDPRRAVFAGVTNQMKTIPTGTAGQEKMIEPRKIGESNKTPEERIADLQARGKKLIDAVKARWLIDVSFLSRIEATEKTHCRYLDLSLEIGYVEDLMTKIEREIKYLLKFGSGNCLSADDWCKNSSLARTSFNSLVCPDDGIKRMYSSLFVRLKPVFGELGVEFETQRGCKITVPHTMRGSCDLTHFVSGLKVNFGGYDLEMQPSLFSLARAMDLLDILKKERSMSSQTKS